MLYFIYYTMRQFSECSQWAKTRFASTANKEDNTMNKNVIALVKELECEVDRKYKLSGLKPDGFEETAFDHKLAILSDMYEQDEELGLVDVKTNRFKAYMQLADLYKVCGSWN